jgi:hypothetical protein
MSEIPDLITEWELTKSEAEAIDKSLKDTANPPKAKIVIRQLPLKDKKGDTHVRCELLGQQARRER